MNGYIELLKYLKESNECFLLEKTAAEMVEKCKNSQVPTEVWIKACILYAKALAANKKPAKAIIALKGIAKVFTPMPYVNIIYTRTLQKAKTIAQLLNPQCSNLSIYDSYKSSFANIRDFASIVIGEADAPQPASQEYQGRRLERTETEGQRCFKKTCITINADEDDDKIDQNLPITPEIPNANTFAGISVCSNPKFLYLLAKIAIKYNICLEDGKCAIIDYLELLKFEKNPQKIEKKQRKAEKIQFLIYG